MRKLLFTLLFFVSAGTSAWATFPTTQVLFSGKVTTGTGLTVNITVSGGALSAVTIAAGGINYASGQIAYVSQSTGTNGVLDITSVSSGVVTGIAIHSGSAGSGYTNASAVPTFVPLNTSLWQQFGANPMQIVSNQIVGTKVGAGSGSYWLGGTFTSSEVFFQFGTRQTTTGDTINLYCDLNPANAFGYFIQSFRNTGGTDSNTIEKRTAGGTTQIGSTFSHTPVNGDSLGLSAIAGTVIMWFRAVDKFTVTSANATAGAVYQDGNGVNYTVASTIASGTTLTVLGLSTLSTYSGTLTKQSGTGDSTIAFSGFTAGTWINEASVADSTYTSGVIAIAASYTVASSGFINFGGGTQVYVAQGMELTNDAFTGQNVSNKAFLAGGTFGITSTLTSYNGTATNPTMTLSSVDNCVTVNAATETFGSSITSGSSASNGTPFSFSLSSGCSTGHLALLYLTPSNTASSGGSGATLNITAAGGIITAGTINSGGTNYTVNDMLYVTQSGASYGKFLVTGISGGVITSVALINGGAVYTTATGAATTNGFIGQPIPIYIYVNVPYPPNIAPTYTCVTNYYISNNGNGQDGALGTSRGTAWATIQNAMNTLIGASPTQAGVCVISEAGVSSPVPSQFLPGNFVNGLSGTNSTLTGQLVFKSEFQYGATIQVPSSEDTTDNGAAGFTFDQASYIVVDGFVILGDTSIALSEENGISFNGYPPTSSGTNLTVINNLLSNHGGAGLNINHSDYMNLQGNIIAGNANTDPFETSGLSLYQAVAHDLNAGFHNRISNNVIFNNTEISDGNLTHTDGNGIIFDDWQNTQGGSPFGVYTPASLAENNLTSSNGGGGIHIFLSDHFTIRNNTSYNNYIDPLNTGVSSIKAEFNTNGGINETFVNNVGYSTPNPTNSTSANVACADANFTGTNTGNVWYNNVCFANSNGQTATYTFNTTATIDSTTGNIVGVNPNFKNISIDDFTPGLSYPTKSAGTTVFGVPPLDLAGNVILLNNLTDGAYQYQAVNQRGSDFS